MSWLFEQPLVIVVIGIVLLLALATAWSATGRKELLYAIGVAVLLTVAGLVVERLVITDREAIRETLLQIARDVQSNDRHAVIRHVYSGAPELKQKAEAELPNYHFTECRITRIHSIDVRARTPPRSATVEFNVMASGSFKQGGMELSDTSVPRWVRLEMVREKDGRWAVQDYKHAPPQQMILDQPVSP